MYEAEIRFSNMKNWELKRLNLEIQNLEGRLTMLREERQMWERAKLEPK